MIPRVADRRIVTYGFCAAGRCARHQRQCSTAAAPTSTSRSSDRATGEPRIIDDLRLPMLGQHNVQNALAAIAVAQRAGHRRRDDPRGASPASPA